MSALSEPEKKTSHFKSLLKFILLLLPIAAIVHGFSGYVSVIKQCKATVTRHITAQYVNPAEGKESDDSQWTEPASYVFTAITLNGELSHRTNDFETKILHGTYYPPTPRAWEDVDKAYFRGYKSHTLVEFKVTIKNAQGKELVIDEPIKKAPACVKNLNGHIYTKTWYGFTYSTDM